MTAPVFVDTNVLARFAQCSVLLTEDLQHGQDLDGLRVIDPFQVPPQEVIPVS